MSDIIRCKDCAFYRSKDGYCAHNHGVFKPEPEDYCSYAEKKLPPKLKSCPFCGSSDVFTVNYANKQYGVVCPGCNVNIGCFDTKEEAVETWNRRFY